VDSAAVAEEDLVALAAEALAAAALVEAGKIILSRKSFTLNNVFSFEKVSFLALGKKVSPFEKVKPFFNFRKF
jgi:hypothetical protein